MPTKSLAEIVQERPYPEYAEWWPMGETFLHCMSEAIVTQWRNLHMNPQPLEQELFLRCGYIAAETEDFDPIGYPSDRVVELWEIRSLA